MREKQLTEKEGAKAQPTEKEREGKKNPTEKKETMTMTMTHSGKVVTRS